MSVKQRMAADFHAALENQDWKALRRMLTDDASWLLPGDNLISSSVINAESLVARAELIANFHMQFEVKQILESRDSFALYQHNTAGQGKNKFVQYVTTLCRVESNKICQIETLVSDMDGFNRFFNNRG